MQSETATPLKAFLCSHEVGEVMLKKQAQVDKNLNVVRVL